MGEIESSDSEAEEGTMWGHPALPLHHMRGAHAPHVLSLAQNLPRGGGGKGGGLSFSKGTYALFPSQYNPVSR